MSIERPQTENIPEDPFEKAARLNAQTEQDIDTLKKIEKGELQSDNGEDSRFYKLNKKGKGIITAAAVAVGIGGFMEGQHLKSNEAPEAPQSHSYKMPDSAPSVVYHHEGSDFVPGGPKVEMTLDTGATTAPATAPVSFEIKPPPTTQAETQPATQPEVITTAPAATMPEVVTTAPATTMPEATTMPTTAPEATTKPAEIPTSMPEATTKPVDTGEGFTPDIFKAGPTTAPAASQPETKPATSQPEVKNGKVPPSFEGTANSMDNLVKGGLVKRGTSHTETTRSAAKTKAAEASTQPEKTEKKTGSSSKVEKEKKENKVEVPRNAKWSQEMVEKAKADVSKLKTSADASIFVNSYAKDFLYEFRFPTQGKIETIKVYDQRVKKRYLNEEEALAIASNAEQMKTILVEVCGKFGMDKVSTAVAEDFNELIGKANEMASYKYQKLQEIERERAKQRR